ncbi:HAD-like protein [Viridothelium virens]|uniref:HAD-like protein n=1 Tax=Viridothelium virens TaxID=1048519 RepID=A0A6A6HN39_VIRVR|nr:HAD-like protein [Viridothelium virens]
MSNPKPRALLFDIGGVCVVSPFQGILDYEKSHNIPTGWVNHAISKSSPNGAWQRLERGEIPLDATFFAAFKHDLEHPSHWAAFILSRPIPPKSEPPSRPSPPPSIDAEALFWRMMSLSRTPDPYMYPALRRLASSSPGSPRPFVLGALSNTVIFPPGHPFNAPADARADLRACFDVFVSSAHVGLRKPDPRIYALALERLREEVRRREREEGKGEEEGQELRAEEVVFLDDIGENLKAARAAGMRTVRVWLGRTEGAVRELEGITGMRLLETESGGGEDRAKM